MFFVNERIIEEKNNHIFQNVWPIAVNVETNYFLFTLHEHSQHPVKALRFLNYSNRILESTTGYSSDLSWQFFINISLH